MDSEGAIHRIPHSVCGLSDLRKTWEAPGKGSAIEFDAVRLEGEGDNVETFIVLQAAGLAFRIRDASLKPISYFPLPPPIGFPGLNVSEIRDHVLDMYEGGDNGGCSGDHDPRAGNLYELTGL